MTSTTTAFLAVTQNLSRYQAMTAAEPAVKSATAYYEANIGSVSSDPGPRRQLSPVVLRPQRLWPRRSDQQQGLITKVLEGGVSNSKSLANTLPDSRWKAFAAGVQFRRQRRNVAVFVERRHDDDQRLCGAAARERSGRPGCRRPACALLPARRADGHQRIWNSGRYESPARSPRRSWGFRPRPPPTCNRRHALRAHADLRLAGPGEAPAADRAVHRNVRLYLWARLRRDHEPHRPISNNPTSQQSGAAAILSGIISSNGLDAGKRGQQLSPARRSRCSRPR